MDDQTKPEHMRAALEAGDVAELVRMARVYADMDSPDYPWSQLNEVKKYLGKCADALTRQSEQIASLTKGRDAQLQETQHAWNERDGEKRLRLVTESRLSDLEQEAVKVVEGIAEEAKKSAAYWNAPGPQSSFYQLEDTARAFLDKLRRPS